VGTRLPPSHGTRDDLVTGGRLDFVDGAVPNGNVIYGQLGVLANIAFPEGEARQGQPIGFPAAGRELEERSTALGAWPATGTTEVSGAGGSVILRGDRPDLNVFDLAGPDLARATSLSIEARAGSTALVNVSGDSGAVRSLGFQLSGVRREQVLLNFPSAIELTIEGVGVQGTILAPRADLRFSNGSIDGTLIGRSLQGTGESHDHRFTGCLPAEQ
jgi:choice-of-anchor A domain-containing protein